MSVPGDHGPEMRPVPLLDDDSIDALVGGGRVPGELANVAALTARIRAVGDRQPPRPSPVLARVFAHGADAVAGARADGRAGAGTAAPDRHAPTLVAPGAARRPAPRRRSALAKVAGLGLAAKIGLGVTTAAAGVLGAGAAGVLPGPVDSAVRGAITAITPFHIGDDAPGTDHAPGGDAPTEHPPGTEPFGDRVSPDATGEVDGVPGVDGRDIAEEAPGADHRPPGAPGAPEGAPADPGEPGGGATPPVPTGPPTTAGGGPGSPGQPPPSPTPDPTVPTSSTTEPSGEAPQPVL